MPFFGTKLVAAAAVQPRGARRCPSPFDFWWPGGGECRLRWGPRGPVLFETLREGFGSGPRASGRGAATGTAFFEGKSVKSTGCGGVLARAPGQKKTPDEATRENHVERKGRGWRGVPPWGEGRQKFSVSSSQKVSGIFGARDRRNGFGPAGDRVFIRKMHSPGVGLLGVRGRRLPGPRGRTPPVGPEARFWPPPAETLTSLERRPDQT